MRDKLTAELIKIEGDSLVGKHILAAPSLMFDEVKIEEVKYDNRKVEVVISCVRIDIESKSRIKYKITSPYTENFRLVV